MEVYNRIIEIIDVNVVYCLPTLILSLLLIKYIFKDKFDTAKGLTVVRWLIISYTLITAVSFIIGMIISPKEYAFTSRATGPYRYVYWFLLFSTTLLPFSLLIKKLGEKFLYVLLIAFFIKIGFYFERFVIIVTSFNNDYAPPGVTSYWPDFLIFTGLFLLQGLLLALLLLGGIEMIERIKSSLSKAA